MMVIHQRALCSLALHHHFTDLGLLADAERQTVRLSANAAVVVTFEEEQSGKPI